MTGRTGALGIATAFALQVYACGSGSGPGEARVVADSPATVTSSSRAPQAEGPSRPRCTPFDGPFGRTTPECVPLFSENTLRGLRGLTIQAVRGNETFDVAPLAA